MEIWIVWRVNLEFVFVVNFVTTEKQEDDQQQIVFAQENVEKMTPHMRQQYQPSYR